MAKSSVNMKQLLDDMDRYLAFCRQRKRDNPNIKPITQIVLTPIQYAEYVKKTGETKYQGVDIVPQ